MIRGFRFLTKQIIQMHRFLNKASSDSTIVKRPDTFISHLVCNPGN